MGRARREAAAWQTASTLKIPHDIIPYMAWLSNEGEALRKAPKGRPGGPRYVLLLLTAALHAQTYDLVIANGRVMDPASGLDAVRYVAVQDGKIAAISATAL